MLDSLRYEAYLLLIKHARVVLIVISYYSIVVVISIYLSIVTIEIPSI